MEPVLDEDNIFRTIVTMLVFTNLSSPTLSPQNLFQEREEAEKANKNNVVKEIRLLHST